jgi:ADP-ribose pyrophosphatase YjhB (NUDIX family)
MNIGVIVGRFQVDSIKHHGAYTQLLEHVQSMNELVYVVLGCAPVYSKENPLDYSHRTAMFREEYPMVTTLRLDDIGDDAVWVANLDRLITENVSVEDHVTLYGSRLSFLTCYQHNRGAYQTRFVPEFGNKYSATKRRLVIKDSTESSVDIRHGIIQSQMRRYDTCFPTVDMVITRDGGKEVLLGQKHRELGSGKWRFPGGMFEPGNVSGRLAAHRETLEETSLDICPSRFRIVDSVEVTEDSRYKHTSDSIYTTIFTVDITVEESEAAQADDDLAELGWFRVEDVGVSLINTHETVWDTYNKTVNYPLPKGEGASGVIASTNADGSP